mmetsp:Transcript_37698/g.58845  ORF Transcript_37698/g.58845 Transcript_37698/m.58845 type:complete len:306 (-) Transcript_37698:38-955(-)
MGLLEPNSPINHLHDTLDAVLHILVQLTQTVQVLLRSIPIATAVGLQEGSDHVTESVRVGVHKTLTHGIVGDESVVGILVDEVVNLSRGSRPSHGVPQTLGDLPSALVPAVKHALVELGVKKLGPCVKADGLGKRADLSVSGGSVSDHGHRLLAVGTQSLDNLGGVRVEVVADVSERDLGGVQVLEGTVDLGERGPEHILGHIHLTRLVRIESETLAGDELLLELLLALPSSVLDGKTNIGRVRPGSVGENTGGSITNAHSELLGLLQGVLAHEVHLKRLVSLGSHLHGPVEQVHLVDEQITEDT